MTMRIALISDHASPLSSLGGVEGGGQNVYVGEVARELARRGCAVDIFTRRDSPHTPACVTWEEGVTVWHVPAGPAEPIAKEELHPFVAEFASNMLSMTSGRPAYDVLHANFYMSGMVARLYQQQRPVPWVITFHALARVRLLHQGAADRFPIERATIEHRLMREADAIIAECPQDRLDMLDLYRAPGEKIFMVPCGVSDEDFWPVEKSLARATIGAVTNEKVIVHVGRMVPRKGVEELIRGLACLVHDHHVPARLLIVGGESADPDPVRTPEIGRLQAIARQSQVLDRIRFVGHRGRDQLRYFYSAADVFVTTPWYEPFGITPLEAMACGTPVIGSSVGGLQYTIRDGQTGRLIPPRNPQRLAEAMAELLSDDVARCAMGSQAVSWVRSQFSWRNVAGQLLQVYRQVLGQANNVPERSAASMSGRVPAEARGLLAEI